MGDAYILELFASPVGATILITIVAGFVGAGIGAGTVTPVDPKKPTEEETKLKGDRAGIGFGVGVLAPLGTVAIGFGIYGLSALAYDAFTSKREVRRVVEGLPPRNARSTMNQLFRSGLRSGARIELPIHSRMNQLVTNPMFKITDRAARERTEAAKENYLNAADQYRGTTNPGQQEEWRVAMHRAAARYNATRKNVQEQRNMQDVLNKA